ncbi:MAG: hypothetical protein ACI89X_002946 [Planctomycetota bacterium]|jgi:hypothetical protein
MILFNHSFAMKTILALLTLSCPFLPAQILLSENFSASTLDPARWQAVTQGVPFGTPAVFVQSGECVLQNRGHLVSVQQFDHQQIGAYSVTCKWRCADQNDRFTLLVRSDGVPTGSYGETQNGVGIAGWMYGGAPQTALVQWGQIQLGPQTSVGPGLTLTAGSTYTASVTDLGYQIKVRMEGPNPSTEWLEIEAGVLGDTTTQKRIAFHNREQTFGSHQCFIDDVIVESLSPPASYTTFGAGCQDPNGQVPSLAAVAGDLPRIGTSSRSRVSNLPLSVTIPVFIFGFSNSQGTGAFGNYPLPQDLGILGWPGCDQLVSLNDSIYTITTSGYADHTITIPAFPFLVGMQFHAQALVLFRPGGVAVSNAVTGTVGY